MKEPSVRSLIRMSNDDDTRRRDQMLKAYGDSEFHKLAEKLELIALASCKTYWLNYAADIARDYPTGWQASEHLRDEADR